MIRSFRHKGVERFFQTGDVRGIQGKHVERIRRQLFALNNASGPKDLNVPGWQLHPLQGKLDDHWSIAVSGNWRLTFCFLEGDVILLDYQDYH
jgi:toxin HigB-1